MERFLELWGKLPTTTATASVAYVLWLGTGARYLTSTSWHPSYDWLGALLLLSGVAGAQWVGKRVTDHGYVAAKKAP